jgi:hypothetical protein
MRGSLVALSGALGIVLSAAPASAQPFDWSWVAPDNSFKLDNGSGNHRYTSAEGIAVNDSAGMIEAVESSFDPASGVFSWNATFGSVPGHSGLEADGFTLALTGGPNPKGVDGELALLYFDASRQTPVLTAYSYNTKNDFSSYYDGSGARGRQRPDRIFSSILDGGVDFVDTLNPDGTHTLGFSLDASSINGHSPRYGVADDWTGIAFGEDLGVWFHPVSGPSTKYRDGYLKRWLYSTQGGFDGSNVPIMPSAPEPSTLLMLAAGAWAALRKRK